MGIGTILGGLGALAIAGSHGTITTDTLTIAGASITTGLGLIFARDNDKSSESQGATPAQQAAVQSIAASAAVVPAAPPAPASAPSAAPAVAAKVGLVLLIAAGLVSCVGCKTGSAPLLTATTNAVPTVQAVQVPVVQNTQTPTIQIVTVTNTVGQVIPILQTNIVTVSVTNYIPQLVTNWQTNIVYAPNSTVTTVLSTATTANTLTGAFDPFSGAIAAILGLSTAGLAWYAKQKTNQVNTHASTIQTLTAAAASLEPAAAAAFHAAVVAQGPAQTTAQKIQAAATAAAANLS